MQSGVMGSSACVNYKCEVKGNEEIHDRSKGDSTKNGRGDRRDGKKVRG